MIAGNITTGTAAVTVVWRTRLWRNLENKKQKRKGCQQQRFPPGTGGAQARIQMRTAPRQDTPVVLMAELDRDFIYRGNIFFFFYSLSRTRSGHAQATNRRIS